MYKLSKSIFSFRKLFSRGDDDDEEDEGDERESNLEVKFFSFTTFWYIVSISLSPKVLILLTSGARRRSHGLCRTVSSALVRWGKRANSVDLSNVGHYTQGIMITRTRCRQTHASFCCVSMCSRSVSSLFSIAQLDIAMLLKFSMIHAMASSTRSRILSTI